MTESEYNEIKEYAGTLSARRAQYPDGQLLNECQAFLNAFVIQLSDGPFEPEPPPVNVDVPYVSGSGSVGATLNCTMGNWTGMHGETATYAYQWMNDGNPALNGDQADYVVVDGDRGHSLTCVVTATNASGSTAAPPSNAVVIPE